MTFSEIDLKIIRAICQVNVTITAIHKIIDKKNNVSFKINVKYNNYDL